MVKFILTYHEYENNYMEYVDIVDREEDLEPRIYKHAIDQYHEMVWPKAIKEVDGNKINWVVQGDCYWTARKVSYEGH